MARALAYAQGDGPAPVELEMLQMIDRFGVTAILGPTPGAGVLRRLLGVERIVSAFRAREASENWAEWAAQHRADNALLTRATRAANAHPD